MKNWKQEDLERLVICRQEGMTWNQIHLIFPEHSPNALRKTYYRALRLDIKEVKEDKPKILLLDLETAPILGYVWQLFDQNVALNQIHSDWYILSWSAKWLGSPENEVMYMDQRNAKNIEDDSEILKGLWKLVDEASIIITQNGKKFDEKKMNARFILNGFKPTSSFRHIDTLQLAKVRFGFTSNKLEYMTSKLCTKYKKLDHDEFSGFKLWSECLKGNKKAFESMKEYNMYDVLSLEELYLKLRPWDTKHPNLNVYNEDQETFCTCGSLEFDKNGFAYTNTGKFQRYTCKKCGAEVKSKENLLSKEKRKSLKKN
jgi:hypothetical protein